MPPPPPFVTTTPASFANHGWASLARPGSASQAPACTRNTTVIRLQPFVLVGNVCKDDSDFFTAAAAAAHCHLCALNEPAAVPGCFLEA